MNRTIKDTIDQERAWSLVKQKVMQPSFLLICFVAWAASGVFPQRAWGKFIAPVEGLYPSRRAQCGPRCLYVTLRLLGHGPDYRRLLEVAETDQHGTSIGGLARAAEEYGVHVCLLSVSQSGLEQLLVEADHPIVAICHQRSEHFVAWYVDAGDNMALVDPSQHPKASAGKVHLEDYSGAALLVSNDPIDIPISSSPLDVWYKTAYYVLTGLGCLFAFFSGQSFWLAFEASRNAAV